jgi:hypothetical protein
MAGHVPPRGVRKAAARGLELRRKFKRGGTRIGIARARDLARGAAVSDSTIKRMVSYFARHAVDRKPGWSKPSNPTNGYIAWLLWGGNAGERWARKVKRQIEGGRRTAVRRNQGLPGDRPLQYMAEEAGVPVQEIMGEYTAQLIQLRQDGIEYIMEVMVGMAREVGQRFIARMQALEPALKVVPAQDQNDLLAFFLTVPTGTYLWNTGREREARYLVRQAKQRLLAVTEDSTLGWFLQRQPWVNLLSREWMEGMPYYEQALATLIDKLADWLYTSLPGLREALFESGVDDVKFRAQLLARVIDRLPLAGAEDLIQTGAFELGDPQLLQAQYGVLPQ